MAPAPRTHKVSLAGNMHVPPLKPKGFFGWRHCQVLLMFLGLACSYTTRVNMSVAIVAMVDAEGANPNFEEFDWDESHQSIILSSFFWGYVVTQIPAGMFAQRYGAKNICTISTIICGLLSLVSPVLVHYGGWMAMCGCRVVMGLTQGVVIPCLHNLLAKWVPPEERGRLGSFVYAGGQFGTVLTLPIAGLLSASSLGWPSVFYAPGVTLILWAILWHFLGAETPDKHKYISFAERQYIEASLGVTEVKERLATPWRHILTSVPFWALFIVNSGQIWGFWTLLTESPTYIASVMNFDIASNGFISALPYLAMLLMSLVISSISDTLIRKGYITTGTSRKICNTIGHWLPAIALVSLGYISSENHVLVIVILVVAVGLNSGTLCGFQINHMDLSPNFAGTMMGITNGIGTIFAIVGPLVVGFIVTDATNVSQWRIVFITSAAIYFLVNLCFVLFGSSDVQWWNEPPPKSNKHDIEMSTNPESSKAQEADK